MRRYKNIYLILIFTFLFIPFGRGQNPFFRTVLTGSDIENSQFNCIFQDHSGFIWLGTDEGVYTFDGHELSLFYLPDTMTNISITAIFEDHDKMLWFGTDEGIILQYAGFENFSTPKTDINVSSRITSFIETVDGTIWAGTYGEGVLVISGDSVYQINALSGLSDDFVYSMITDDNGNIWMGTDNGIQIIDRFVSPAFITSISVKEGLPDYIVHKLLKDQDGNILIGMHDEGVCYFNPKKNSFYTPEPFMNWDFGVVNDLLLIDQHLWIATDKSGVVDYDIETGTLSIHEPCTENKSTKIKSFVYDDEGNVWLLSNQEVCISLADKIEFFDSWKNVEIKNIHALAVDRNDNLWFANDQGLFQYNPREKDEQKKLKKHLIRINPQTQKIMSLYQDVYGFIWAGTFGQGVIRLEPSTGEQILLSEKDGLVNNNVLSINGNQNELWFGTLGGASRISVDETFSDIRHEPEFKNYGQKEGLVNSYIYQVYISPDNIPYFATDGSGVYYFINNEFHNISGLDEFHNKIIYSVTSDSFGNIWMNAANDGLYKFDGEKITKVINDPDHKNLSFSGIICNKEELIILYDDGVDVMDIQSSSIIHYETNAGLEKINPDLNTIGIDSKDNVWMGTEKGIIKYRSGSKKSWNFPQTRLTEVALFLKETDFSTKEKFYHNENHFSFSFTGLWFQFPEKVEYFYTLEGHDLTWMKTKNNRAVYSDLKPGKYTFRARAGIYNNYPEENEVSYEFEIKKPYYENSWFYVLLTIIIGLLVYLIVKLRIRQIKKRQVIIQERIRFQFENLKSQINPHFLFNSFSTLVALIETDSSKAVEYVDELSILFRHVLEYKDQDLIHFSEELTIANNYLNVQKKRFGKNLIIEIDPSPDYEKLWIPPLTLQLLIENAIKHNVVSNEKPLHVKIYSDQEKNLIFVKNNLQPKQEGIDSTGIGINNIINRYRLISDKKVEVNKTRSEFIVGLPYILKQ